MTEAKHKNKVNRMSLPGTFISIGTRQLHVMRVGAGQPLVVLESGSGNFSLDWQPVMQQIAEFTEVLAYDRAGHGWSDSSPSVGPLCEVVNDLHKLLQALNESAPVVLVGHSLGGLYAQLFARQHPDRVAGMVLLDSSHPDIYPLMSQTALYQNRRRVFNMWLASCLGLLRRRLVTPPEAPAGLPVETRRLIESLWLQPKFWRTMLKQSKFLDASIANVFAATGPFPDIPLIVVAPPNADWTRSLGDGMPDLWSHYQQQLANLSPQGTFICAEKSGHMIHHDEPELVVTAVKNIVDTLRKKQMTYYE